MSEHDFQHVQKLFEEVKLANKKWSLRTIGAWFAGLLLFFFGIGVRYEDWVTWREKTDEKVIELRTWKEAMQNIKNSERANYNSHIIVKQP